MPATENADSTQDKTKYKKASKKELSNSLYKMMPATLDTAFAKQVTQLQSEVVYKHKHDSEKGKSTYAHMLEPPDIKHAMEVNKHQSNVSYKKGAQDIHKYTEVLDRPDIQKATEISKIISNVDYRKAKGELSKEPMVLGRPDFEHAKEVSKITSQVRCSQRLSGSATLRTERQSGAHSSDVIAPSALRRRRVRGRCSCRRRRNQESLQTVFHIPMDTNIQEFHQPCQMKNTSSMKRTHNGMRSIDDSGPNIRRSLSVHPIMGLMEFLDVSVHRNMENCLETRMFRKETAVNALLHATSAHPPTMINSIPIGQFLRLRRICSEDTEFEKQASELRDRFLERGYSRRSVKKGYNRAKNISRHQALYGTKPAKTNQVVKYKEQFEEMKGKKSCYNPLDSAVFRQAQAASALASDVKYKKDKHTMQDTSVDLPNLLHLEHALKATKLQSN
ncbi:unnamed protein product, partial [Ranitomeya imitator]